jgi:hypothetical protein
VVRRFKDDQQGHLREVAQLPEAPVTVKYQPPYDLQDVLPNPGEPINHPIHGVAGFVLFRGSFKTGSSVLVSG